MPNEHNRFKPEEVAEADGDRIALFVHIGADDKHAKRYADYTKTRKYLVDAWRKRPYDDEARQAAKDAGLNLRDLPAEVMDDPTAGLNELWQPFPYEGQKTAASPAAASASHPAGLGHHRHEGCGEGHASARSASRQVRRQGRSQGRPGRVARGRLSRSPYEQRGRRRSAEHVPWGWGPVAGPRPRGLSSYGRPRVEAWLLVGGAHGIRAAGQPHVPRRARPSLGAGSAQGSAADGRAGPAGFRRRAHGVTAGSGPASIATASVGGSPAQRPAAPPR